MAQRAIVERQAIESAAEDSVRQAEQRRCDAERRVEELKQKRRQAEVEHSRSLSTEDLNNESHVAAIAQEIEVIWKAAAAHAKQARSDTAAQRAREEREIAEINTDFERRSAAYERSLEEYDALCAERVAEAQKRVREAEEAVQKVWEESQVMVQSSREEAEGCVQEHTCVGGNAVDDTNQKLCNEELQLATELADIAARVKAVNDDRSAEEWVVTLRTKVYADIDTRRALCDKRVKECLDIIARLTSEASEAAAAAAHRAQMCQVKTDRQVEEITAGMEKFGDSSHKDKFLEVQSSLNDVARSAKEEFSQRFCAFQEEVDQQTREADRALVNADRKVEELRVWASGLIDEKAQAMDRSIEDIRTQRGLIVAESSAKVQKVQDQMVQYVGSQFEDMLASLSKSAPEEVPLRLDYSSAVNGGEKRV